MSFADSWDNFSDMDRVWDGQKSITNKEFEEAVETIEGNQKQQEEKQRQKLIKKISGGGESLHSDLNPNSNINDIIPVSRNEEGMLLNIPVNLVIDGNAMDKGFYKVVVEKDKNNEVYLSFYQSQFLMGKVKAYTTEDDYDEEYIDFVKLLPYSDNFVKIIYGSLDFNAYAYIQFLR